MAVVTYDAFAQDNGVAAPAQNKPFANIIKLTYEKPFLKSLDQDTAVFTLFPRKSTDDLYIRWKVKSGANAGTEFYEEEDAYGAGIGMTGVVANSSPQIYDSFNVKIMAARVNVSFSNLSETAKGAAWIDIRADEVEGALRDLRSGLNDAFLRLAYGTDFRRPESIGSIVGDFSTSDAAGPIGTQTYGSGVKGSDGLALNRSSTSYFSSVVDATAVARPLTLALMQKQYALLQRPARAASINKILTSPGLCDAYGDIADSRRRWNVGDAGRSGKIDLGYSGLEFKGIPILGVQRFPDVSAGASSRMYMLDTASWNVYTLKAFETDEVSTTNDTTQLAIKCYLALVCKAPFRQGVISDLTSTY